MKILFVCKKRLDNYGASLGPINSARFVARMLAKHFKINTKVVLVIDNNFIDREVHAFRPDAVIVEAIWVVPDKFRELIAKYPKIDWYVRCHSEIPFIAYEGNAIDWLFRYKYISDELDRLHISSNSLRFTHSMQKLLNHKIDYLPNMYDLEDAKVHHKNYCEMEKDFIHIGCFGAIRPYKNHLTQAIAAMRFADEIKKVLYFHINASRIEHADSIYKNLVALFDNSPVHTLARHRWYFHSDFIEVVKKMDIGMQVSFSESYNIVTADFVSSCIPVVVSNEISWVSKWFWASPNSVGDIVNKLHRAYNWKRFGIKKNLEGLKDFNKKSLQTWADYFLFLR